MSQIAIETAIIMLVGLLGGVLPIVPGPPLIWLGAVYYGYRTDWIDVGWPSLTLLLLLAIVGSTSDLWMGYLGARRGGASGWASLASLVGGLIGLLIFSLPGAIIGSIGTVALLEYRRHGNWQNVLRASGGYIVGWLLSVVVKLAISVLMIIIFIMAVNL